MKAVDLYAAVLLHKTNFGEKEDSDTTPDHLIEIAFQARLMVEALCYEFNHDRRDDGICDRCGRGAEECSPYQHSWSEKWAKSTGYTIKVGGVCDVCEDRE